MPKPTPKTKPRLLLKTSLAKAVELISSDKVLLAGVRQRWVLQINKDTAQLLIKIVGKDANQGWAVLYGLDRMTLYGTQIYEAFNNYCFGDVEKFIECAKEQDSRLTTWMKSSR